MDQTIKLFINHAEIPPCHCYLSRPENVAQHWSGLCIKETLGRELLETDTITIEVK